MDGFYAEQNAKVTTPADAISVLAKKGIISCPDVWYGGTWSDDDFKCLLIKVANDIEKR